MLQDIVTTLILITCFLSLIIAIGQLFVKTRRIENYNLSFFFFCCAVLFFQFFFIINGAIFKYPSIFFTNLTCMSLMAPLLYYAYFFLCLPEVKPPGKALALFAPVPLMLAADVIYQLEPYDTKILILKYLYMCDPLPEDMVIRYVFLVPYVWNAIGFTLLLAKLIAAKKTARNRRLIDISISHVAISIALSVMYFAGYITCSMSLIEVSTVVFCLSIIIAFLVNQRYPEYFQLVIIDTVRDRYRRSRLSGIDSDSIAARLAGLMEQEKVFADEDLTLRRLALELSITPHQLSQLLNEKLDTNFNSFVNQYRVKEAKKMLVDEPDRSIMSICRGAGFNSKSAFYKAFSQCTGMTPHKYRKEVLPKKDA